MFDDESRPAVGATVVLLGTSVGTVTDAKGMFEFPSVPAGTYTVEVSHVGYRRERLKDVSIRPGTTTDVSVRLSASPFHLDAVVVTGTLNRHILKDAPVLTEVIGARELDVIGSKNLAEVLQNHTGVEIETGIGQIQNASLHGLYDSHVLVLVDGERISGKVDGAIDLAQVPITMVDRIEVVKGPLSSIYGSDALGGVINILTKNSDRTELNLSATGGTLGRQDYTLSGSHAFADLLGVGRSMRLLANVSHNRFAGVDYVIPDRFQEMPGSQRTNLNLKTVGQVTERLVVELKADHYRDRLDWLAGDLGITYLRDYSTNQKLTLGGNGTYTFSPEASLKVSANKSQNDRRSWETTASGFLTRDSYARELVQTYRVQGTVVPYHNSILTMGLEYGKESLLSSRLAGGTRSVSNQVVYAEDEWNLGVGTLAFGARYSHNSAFSTVLAPRVSVMVPVTEHTTLRASYGRGYREPSLMELYIDFDHSSIGYAVKGEPGLMPEDSRGLTAGLQYDRGDLVWFRLSYFRNTLKNLIDYYVLTPGGPGMTTVLSYRNVERAVTEGVDVDVDLVPFSGTMFSLGYNYVRAVDGRGFKLPFRTPHTVTAKVNTKLPFWDASIDLRTRWSDRKPVSDDQLNRDIYSAGEAPQFTYVPAHAVTDVRLAARPLASVEFFVGINNLFDVTQFPYGQMKPRQYFAGFNASIY
ncbi:MAG: TonB-dependent receptor [Bacteroidetes bacterium]|nr:TonB-dependent receptor [Bacteroidota bacterium]